VEVGVRTLKKRPLFLLLPALVVAVLVLVLPAGAFAGEATVYYGTDVEGFFDFETGTASGPGETPCVGHDIGLFHHARLCIWTYASPTQFAGLSNEARSVTWAYETITWADISALSFGWAWDASWTEFVVKTEANNYYKVKLVAVTPSFCTFLYEQLVESAAPSAMLDALRTFIVTANEGAVDARMQTSLLAKVSGASAALARGGENSAKVAVNELKALVNQVKAQGGKKIESATATEIIEQANAIIAALGY
jgi:hypothetical protein